ncbi:hypothetical protein LTR84_001115 [Exophiala bonariae]|uniref:Conserved oligomeric Golgi complex subunit 1 n=1 Tax=Exophiala bonariae TaxID=1690606 RepID=A0AAV9NSS9_9EURO|nr:hypothetical protein LTR84_001115 [Exophiala bonariae]
MESVGTITTWQQAFEEYRIPTTRVIEKQLKSSATRDKEKLRTLVGGSYRELLATAESIVVLDSKTKTAEEHMSIMGHNCRPPNHDTGTKSHDEKKIVLAELRLLQRCCTTIASILRETRFLHCSQLMVVSRLLLKSLSEHQLPAPSLDLLRNKVAHLRRQLLRQIDARFTTPVSNLLELVEAICSYCLITSVSSEDALSHLHQLRLDKIRRMLQRASDDSRHIQEALRYQLVSLQTFKALVGRPLAEAMTNMQKRAILTDQTLRNLESLDLDRTVSLISSDIQSFVPYFKKSTLSADDARAKLENWSDEASRVLVTSLKTHLNTSNDTAPILNLRQDLYTALLPSYFSTPGAANMHQQIRQIVNEKLQIICSTQVRQLQDITASLTKRMPDTPEVKSLWDEDTAKASANTRGSRLIKQVKSRHTGHHSSLNRAQKSLGRWIASIKATEASFTALSTTSWRDLMEEPDEEDEEEALDLSKQLGKTDAEGYVKFLQDSLRAGLSSLEAGIIDAATQIGTENPDISRSVALLRSIRMSVAALQDAFPDHMTFEKIHAAIPQLHDLVAIEVVNRLSEASERKKRSVKSSKERLPEDMPSPRAFVTLRRLCEIMFEIGGTDIWSATAVEKIKIQVQARVFNPEHNTAYMMNDFDEAYLRAALGSTTDTVGSASHSAGGHDRAAQEYWTRTKLLFGLLS